MAYAKNALLSGMQLLSARDEFTVVAFDHEQVWWTGAQHGAAASGLAGAHAASILAPQTWSGQNSPHSPTSAACIPT
jgi:hypothetical protein